MEKPGPSLFHFLRVWGLCESTLSVGVLAQSSCATSKMPMLSEEKGRSRETVGGSKERKRWSREVIPPIRGEAFLEEIVVRGHFSTLGSQTRCSGEVDNHGPGNHGLKFAIITKRSQRAWRS